MSDFAKASMVSLIVHQLKRTHPELLPTNSNTVDAIRHAHVTMTHKRDFLDLVWREAGAETLLSVGQGIRDISYDPIWHAAVRSANPTVMFDKWRRFEAFGHSRNRVRIDRTHEKGASFERYAVGGGMPTTPENLLVCGVIVALLEENGCLGLRCDMPLDDGATYRIREDGRFFVPDDANTLRSATWTIDWQRFSSKTGRAAAEAELLDITLPQSCGATLRNSIDTVVRLLMRDVSRQWTVAGLACEAGLSTRTLQRKLHDAELSFSHLVRLVRIHEACRLLKNSDASATTIGFCSGFSDSAHFSRDFRASLGMTPSDYRAVWQDEQANSL